MITFISGRRSGKTAELIFQCKKLNAERGTNSIIIVTKDSKSAENLYALAQKLGCGDIPYPIPVYDLLQKRPTQSTNVIIGDTHPKTDTTRKN